MLKTHRFAFVFAGLLSIFLTWAPFAANADTFRCEALIFGISARALPAPVRTQYWAGPAQAFPLRDSQNITSLRVMTYNVKNLFTHVGLFERVRPNAYERKSDAQPKPEREIVGIKKAIEDSKLPDLIAMEEIDTLQDLTDFAEKRLDGLYQPFLIEGNDPRGIDVGFLVRKDLPITVSEETHKDVMWNDPADHGKSVPLFSRDLPALIIRRNNGDPTPLLILIGNHGKSKRERPGDPESNGLRAAQYRAAAKIIDEYTQRFGPNTPIILAGDFNTDLRNSPEVSPLKERLHDALDIMKVTGKDRVTHTFHPMGGSPQYSQLDGILVNEALVPYVKMAQVYRYTDANGNPLPLPKSYKERERNPSDHYPIIMDISTERIFPEAFPEPH